jgi:phytoene dehydrogenase-like protein
VPHDVVIVGGGHNGLVAAAVLARAGLKPVVLEQHDRVGGCVVTGEIAPGFRGPSLAHRVSLDPSIVRLLALERYGLELVASDALVSVPSADGRLLTLWRDDQRAGEEIQRFSARDARSYTPFLESFRAVAAVMRTLTHNAPPPLDNGRPGEIVGVLKAVRAFRGLGKADAYRLLRWLPMPVADLVGEWFETECLRAVLAGGGILGSFLGPRSPGSGGVLLLLGSGSGHPAAAGPTARGGPGAVGDALAQSARASGADVRTGVHVREIVVNDGSACGVVLSSGERIEARAVLSNADPKRTLLDLLDPVHVPRELALDIRNIRVRGTLAKVNFAVSSLPRLAAIADRPAEQQAAVLAGAVRLSPDVNSVERAFDAAKYGRYSTDPWIELTVPTLLDRDLAPSGHVVSVYAQYAPYELRGASWTEERDRFAAAVASVIERHAPGFARSIVAREVITPRDLDEQYGLSGGHIFHGEIALDQWFVARPLLGWARFATPVRRLFLCGAGTHPGTGDGLSGALAARAVIDALRRR